MNIHVLPLILGHDQGHGAGISADAGLTDAECFAIACAAARLPGSWYVQYDEDDQGHASISFVPNDGSPDDEAPVFLLWREGGVLRLGYGQGEVYAGLGLHVDVDALMGAVRRHLEDAVAFQRWIRIRVEL